MADMVDIWSYLSQGPLLWLAATLIAFAIGDAIFRLLGKSPYAHPVLIAVVLLGGLLWLTGTSYATYFEGAQFVHFLLGPATVCLALPLYDALPRLKTAMLPVLAALAVGTVVAAISAVGIAYGLGITGETLVSLAPKSATAPVAIGIAEAMGGSPTLAAVFALFTGILGAIIVGPLFDLCGIRDWRARGFALGVASHGIGTARALQVHPTAGAFAGLGMALGAVSTSFIAPFALALFR